MRMVLAAVPVLSALMVAPAVADHPCNVRWASSAKAAIKTTREEKRPLLVYLTAPDCYWCGMMKKNTYCNPKVADEINRSFVPVILQQHEAAKLIAALNIQAYPTTVAISPKGKVLVHITGYRTAEQFRKLLVAIAKQQQSKQ